jgi:hypothetical protein
MRYKERAERKRASKGTAKEQKISSLCLLEKNAGPAGRGGGCRAGGGGGARRARAMRGLSLLVTSSTSSVTYTVATAQKSDQTMTLGLIFPLPSSTRRQCDQLECCVDFLLHGSPSYCGAKASEFAFVPRQHGSRSLAEYHMCTSIATYHTSYIARTI